MTRLFDIAFSVFGLVILSPVMLVIGIFIKADSKGPIFYRQQRIGQFGKSFSLYKLRSMHIDADKRGLLITVGGNDQRITRMGVFIRKYKLDELPQLINVLKGEMSIVGPRPEVKKYVDLYTTEQRNVLTVRPGITDLASIIYKNENELLESQSDPERYYVEKIMPDKIRLNQIFISTPNIQNYFRIIFLTIKEVFGMGLKDA